MRKEGCFSFASSSSLSSSSFVRGWTRIRREVSSANLASRTRWSGMDRVVAAYESRGADGSVR